MCECDGDSILTILRIDIEKLSKLYYTLRAYFVYEIVIL